MQDTTPVVQSGAPKSITVEVTCNDAFFPLHFVNPEPEALDKDMS